MMEENVKYVGIDVDSKNYHVAILDHNSGEVWEFKCKPAPKRLIKKFKSMATDLGFNLNDYKVCYESSYIGFSLARKLCEAGISCEVIASSLIPGRHAKQKKTDRLDTMALAEYYSQGMLTAVNMPDVETESDRSLVRSRQFLVGQIGDLKRKILSLCQVTGLDYRQETGKDSATYFTQAHLGYLSARAKAVGGSFRLNMDMVLSMYDRLQEGLRGFDQEIEKIASKDRYIKRVQGLLCFKGIGLLTAVICVLEIGDIRRFGHPKALTSFCGFDIHEYSSGAKQRRFGITGMGNKYLRRVLVLAVQMCKQSTSRLSYSLRKRREKASLKQRDIADRCMNRLHKRSWHLLNRNKHPNVVKVACARELLGFMWESMMLEASV